MHIEITGHQGQRLAEWTRQIEVIPADSSASYGMIKWDVEGDLGDTFQITATLQDATGYGISANEYVLLIGDQEEARKQCHERARQFQTIKSKFPTADYYRFFPELSGEKHDC